MMRDNSVESGRGAQLDNALALHDAGHLDAAEQLYLDMLRKNSSDFDALLQLGALRLQQGHAQESLELTRQALLDDPRSVEALSNLATALCALGRHDEAVATYEAALAGDPDLAEAHCGLGAALTALGRHDEASSCFERALAIDPDYGAAQCGLGASLHALKRLEQSVSCFRRAVALEPGLADAHYGLAAALKGLKREDEALESYRRALALNPDLVEARIGLGICQRTLDRYDAAIAEFEAALALAPDHDGGIIELGKTLEELGRTQEAQAAFARAYALSPRKPGTCCAFAMSRRLDADHPCIATMEELARDRSLREEEQVQLRFALAKAYEDAGRHEDGFSELLKGNALKRRLTPYDEAGTLQAIDRLAAAFSPAIMGAGRGAGNPSAVPIFIVGMPRSGSTLVEQILASHPQVNAGGERKDFAQAMGSVGLDVSRTSIANDIRLLAGEDLHRLGSAYLARLDRAIGSRTGATRMTDKMPMNFFVAPLIHLALPHARIIHTGRDPVDTCLSCFSTPFEQPFAYDLGELGRYHRAYARLMDRWRELVPSDVMLDVRYEDVVNDIEGQARRILAHCGLPWDAACLDFHLTKRPVKTASVNQVRKAIYRESVGRWRPGDQVLAPLLAGLAGDDNASSRQRAIARPSA